MILKNTYDGNIGKNNYLSFTEGSKAMRVIYEKSQAMPILFIACAGRPHVYTMSNRRSGEQGKYVSFSDDGIWLYARYPNKGDAM